MKHKYDHTSGVKSRGWARSAPMHAEREIVNAKSIARACDAFLAKRGIKTEHKFNGYPVD